MSGRPQLKSRQVSQTGREREIQETQRKVEAGMSKQTGLKKGREKQDCGEQLRKKRTRSTEAESGSKQGREKQHTA